MSPSSQLPLKTLAPDDPNYAVQLVDQVLQIAVARGASDIHLHPRAASWEILLRIDGVLQKIADVPKGTSTDPAARLMVMAHLPTYQAGRPQEGRLVQTSMPGAADMEMRLGTFPTVHGSRVVVRLFQRDAPLGGLSDLGLDRATTAALEELCRQTDGAVLTTGPAGSGKTTTLYACLRRIAADPVARRSIVTIEDPPELLLDGVSQSQLDPAAGMTLAAALRSAVRQDPEVLLVSEIRDPETAEAALQASLTGHLVFSSLHAADVVTALRRLVQMGLPSYLIRSGTRAICSQRLLRRICPACGGPRRRHDRPLPNCDRCGGTGYSGRVPIAELLRFDGSDPLGEMVADELEAGRPVGAVVARAEAEGMITLARAAWRLVDSGVTDERELYRVLGRRGARGQSPAGATEA